MEYKDLFKPKPNMSEQEKKQLAENILSAFPYINITLQKNNSEISAIQIDGKIIFKENDNGKR